MLARRLLCKIIKFKAARQTFFKPQASKSTFFRHWFSRLNKILPLALCIGLAPLSCASEEQREASDELQQLTMSELVQVLHSAPAKQFVVVIYDRFKKVENQSQFASELKAILQECQRSKITKIYTINSKDADYLKEIVRRLKNQPLQQPEATVPKQNKKIFQCYFKSKCYPEAFELINAKEYKISEQIKEIRHLEIQTNKINISEELDKHIHHPFNINKNIVVKQCPGQGECVDSFKREVKRLIDEGMFTRKSEQFEFQVIVDHPTGILNKSTDYVKNFQTCTVKLTGKSATKKEETYLFRKDILGSQVLMWNEWLSKEGLNYDSEDRMMMFLRPRIHIVSKYSTFTDLLWYLRSSRLNQRCSLSLNNTEKWSKSNSQDSLQVLKLLYHSCPTLNYLIINTKSVAEIFKHVYADHKYVLFQQSKNPVWSKIFLNLDKLQPISKTQQRQTMFTQEFKETINNFIANPTPKDLVVVEKQLEISFDKLKTIRQRQMNSKEGQTNRNYIVRVCHEYCNRYLQQDVVEQLSNHQKQKLSVYWIDNKTQNVGANVGDYLLKEGKLIKIDDVLNELKKE